MDEGMRYCPRCETEYRPGFEACADCGVELVSRSLQVEEALPEGLATRPELVEWAELLRRGRRFDAEVARSVLESHGVRAQIWSSGLGVWRMESALTEVTGVPNAFNSHRVR